MDVQARTGWDQGRGHRPVGWALAEEPALEAELRAGDVGQQCAGLGPGQDDLADHEARGQHRLCLDPCLGLLFVGVGLLRSLLGLRLFRLVLLGLRLLGLVVVVAADQGQFRRADTRAARPVQHRAARQGTPPLPIPNLLAHW